MSQRAEVALGKAGPLTTLRGLRLRRRLRARLRALAPREVVSPRVHSQASPLGFYVVHWNAPDFLDVTLAAVAAHHPGAPMTVLDNGSQPAALREAHDVVARHGSGRLLAARPDKPRHTVALQALFDVALCDGLPCAAFLDQDTLLLHPLGGLVDQLDGRVLLVGARDAVRIPQAHGPLAAGWLRHAPDMLHPSLLLLRPAALVAAVGPLPFVDHPQARRAARRGGWEHEPYHGLSLRCQGHIRYLECRMSDVLPPLTCYEAGGTTYAAHAWYSSRTEGLDDAARVDGTLPVAWIRQQRAAILAWMQAQVGDRINPTRGDGPTTRPG